MKLKNTGIVLVTMTLIVAALLSPAFFADPMGPPLTGPDLSSLDFQDIRFSSGDLRLAGMLFAPTGVGPFPAVVVIQGSGTSRRTNTWYLSVARHLQQNGIAVLLPDKRGSERSEGQWVGADFKTLAGDALAGVEYVRNQTLFAPSAVGLLGMSQGGWIAPIAAAQDRSIRFVASMSGASVTTYQQLLHEEVHNISRYTWPFAARLLAPWTTRRILKTDRVKPYADYDPIPYWKQVTAPVFFAFGENDENVPVDASVKTLRENLKDAFVRVYPMGGHAIMDRKTGRVQDAFLDDLVKFIHRSAGG